MSRVIQQYPEFHHELLFHGSFVCLHQGFLVQNMLLAPPFPQTGYATQKEVVTVAEMLALQGGNTLKKTGGRGPKIVEDNGD